MSEKKILYVIHPSLSHINASRKLLDILWNRNYKIVLCTNTQGKSNLKGLPWEMIFVDSMPFASGFEEQTKLNYGRGRYYDTLLLKKSNHFYKHRRNAFSHVLQKVRPNIILIDVLYSTDIVFLFNWSRENNCTILYVRTKVNSIYNITTPPMNSTYNGKNSIINILLWKRHAIKKKFHDILSFFKFQGFDDRSSLLKSLDNKSVLKTSLCWYQCVGSQFMNIPELVLMPQEFEMPSFQPRPASYYIGFQYDLPIQFGDIDGGLMDIIRKSRSLDHKIIYISFGSLYEKHRKKIKLLLQKVKTALKGKEKITCILSLKSASSLLELPQNMHAFDFVNQITVLKHADVYITHGGINSIKESLAQEVPMLVYPLNQNWDQPGNSVRVRNLGLGLKGNIHLDSIKEVGKKLDRLLNDNYFIKNIQKFNVTANKYSEKNVIAALRNCGLGEFSINESTSDTLS